MLCLSCTTITSVYLTHYGVSRAKDWVSVDCGTMLLASYSYFNIYVAAISIVCHLYSLYQYSAARGLYKCKKHIEICVKRDMQVKLNYTDETHLLSEYSLLIISFQENKIVFKL